MSSSSGLGFGGFLLGLGGGWLILKSIDVSINTLSWLIIIAGAAIVVLALLSWNRPNGNIKKIGNGLIGGFILSLFISGGLGIVGDIFGGVDLGDYRAEEIRTFSGFVASDRIYLEVNNFNGLIRVSSWEENDYNINLRIRAKGTTDNIAENNLEKFKVEFDESTTQNQMRLILGYDIPTRDYSKYAVEVEVSLPENVQVDLDLGSSNGAVFLTEITGKTFVIETSNGELVFSDVKAEKIEGDTSNGRIRGVLEAPETSLSTSNGKIDLRIPSTMNGEYDLSTSNGEIDIELSSSTEVGYDLDLTTSNGNIDIDLPNLDYTQDKKTEKEARTKEFDSKTIKIKIEASTSNGDVDVYS